MELSLPAFIPNVPEAVKSKLSKAEQQSILFGCPQKYLYLAGEDYRQKSSHAIHNFRSVYLKKENGSQVELLAKSQAEQIHPTIDALWTTLGKVVVINSHPFIQRGSLLFWHIVNSLAARRTETNAADFNFNFVGLFRTESSIYTLKPRHVIGYGPCADTFSDYDYKQLMFFMTRFEHNNRILLCSTPDINQFFQKFNCSPDCIDFLFQMECGVAEEVKVDKKVRSLGNPKLSKRKREVI